MNTFCLLGVRLTSLTVMELHDHIADAIHLGRHDLVLNVNINAMNLAYENIWMRNLLNQAPIVFVDGYGVSLGARLMGHSVHERITYADWMWQLAEFAEQKQYSLYFLGASPGIADAASIVLKEEFPRLQIVGTHHGYFNMESESSENDAVIDEINNLHPNILVLGFGMPLQERWLSANWHRIDANIALTGGAVFDYVSGQLKRGPQFLTEYGFEWFARLLIEPRRLWRRYLIGNPIFFLRMLKQKFGLLHFDDLS